jgi:hypothetical protein
MQHASTISLLGIITTISGLVVIGGLAIICFTKAFSVVFLGSPRHEFHHEVTERSRYQLAPLYFIVALIVSIGLFPKLFLDLLIKPVQLFTGLQQPPFTSFQGNGIEILLAVSKGSLYLILAVLILWIIRKLVVSRQTSKISTTWGCGYTAPNAKIQYTGSSFSKTYSKLFGMIFQIKKKETEVQGIFPTQAHLETSTYDKIEKWLIDYPIINVKHFLGRFLFIQNGRVQSYVSYGIVFIVFILLLTIFNIVL